MPLTVESVIVSEASGLDSPPLKIPPPLPNAVLPLTVESVSVSEPKLVIPPPIPSGEPEPPVIVRRVMAAVTPRSTVTTEPDLAPSSVAWLEP